MMWQGLHFVTLGPIRFLLDASFDKQNWGLMVVVYRGDKLGYARAGPHCMFVYLGLAVTLLKFVVGIEICKRINT